MADTDCTQHRDPVDPRPQHVCKCTTGLTPVGPTCTDIRGQSGSCSLIQLLQLLHHCGCDTVQHIETSSACSQATSPGKKHRHNTVNITDTTHITDKTMHDRHNYCNSMSLAPTYSRNCRQHTPLVQNDKSCLKQLMNFIRCSKHFIQIPLRNKPIPNLGEER